MEIKQRGSHLDHLDAVSRIADGSRFLRRNRDLTEYLRQTRLEFFRAPNSFEDERLQELEQVSLYVSSLPFLAGSAALPQ